MMKKRFAGAVTGAACVLLSGCFFSRGALVEKSVYDIGMPQKKIAGYQVRFGAFRNLSGASRSFLFQQKNGSMHASRHRSFLLAPEALLERYLREVLNSGSGAVGKPLQLSAVIRRFEFSEAAHEAVFDVEYVVRRDSRNAVRGGLFRVPYREDEEEKAMGKCFELSLPMLQECIRAVEVSNAGVKK